VIPIREARPEELADLEALQRRASLANPGDREAILAHPDAIRAKDCARDHSASWLHVVGNPHAEGFYEACGFVTYGSHDTEFGPGLLMRVGVNHRAGGQPRA
jgi:hypothetical protein